MDSLRIMRMELRLIFGDQLSPTLPSLRDANPSRDIVFMCEVAEEANLVPHHKKKLVFLFSAMRHFAAELRAKGFHVDYVQLDDAANQGSFSAELARAVQRHKPDRVSLTEPSEHRVMDMVAQWQNDLPCAIEVHPDNRFYCSPQQFAEWADGRKLMRMEDFYRKMRRDHNVLMHGDKPEGGRWNFDADNRKPPKDGMEYPAPLSFAPDQITQDVLHMVERAFPSHFGTLEGFDMAVTADQASQVLAEFIDNRLPQFGTYQDAMVTGQPFMFHSLIAPYLNAGLLSAQSCVSAAVMAYEAGRAPLNAVEGFVRQIIGWREFVRGIYWQQGPDYGAQNALNANKPLPAFYWSAETDMNCLHQCVSDTQRHAYAHHIQRLMVLGNFALLTGVDPAQLNEWFLAVYADAFEWVERPNVTGMALYADGGLLASKPYAASGAYINRMSDYCKGCKYSVTQKTGPKACPFNYLYWDFLIRHQDQLADNQRMRMPYRNLARMSDERRSAITDSASHFLKQLSG